jgi:hypothetical protein
MRCKHDQQWQIAEVVQSRFLHTYDSGGFLRGASEGYPTGAVDFDCLDCGFSKRYYSKSKNLPKWLQARLEQATGLK